MNKITQRLSLLPPLLALGALLGLAKLLPNRVVVDEAAQAHMVKVSGAMESVPFFIGDWIGKDEPLPPEAQKLLRPNAMFSRVYQKPGGPRVQVVMVHCTDARDMIGHYPPICYPSSGWLPCPTDEAADPALPVGTSDLPVRHYKFSRVRETGQEDQIRIFNAFVLPDGNVTRDISDINRQSERRAVSARGVAQLQVITSSGISDAEAAELAGELLTGMKDLFSALRVGEGAARDA